MDADNITMEELEKLFGLHRQKVADWERMARAFGVVYVLLGCLAIALNSCFLYCILRKRNNTFAHVFYIMILNFTVIDIMKGICSILYAIKLLKPDMGVSASLYSVKIDQYSGMLLRFCNLATIINLSMITLNEYIFIKHPLRYAALVTRGRVVASVAIGWLLSFSVTLGNVFAMSASRTFMIDQNCLADTESADDCVTHTSASHSMHVTYHIGVIAFCMLCLALTSCCYLVLLRIITTLIRDDQSQRTQLRCLKNADDSKNDDHHVIKRHKYLVVIGTVICVYTVYLITYAVIQVIQLASIASPSTHNFVTVKYVCYLFISLHSLLQPLCYLRMTEFRQLLYRGLCRGRRRESLLTEHVFVSSRREVDQAAAL